MIHYIKDLYNSIFNKVSQIFTLKKPQLLDSFAKELAYTEESLGALVNDLLKAIENKTIDLKALENEPLLKRLRPIFSNPIKSNLELFKTILLTSEEIAKLSPQLTQLLVKNLPNTITHKTITVKELALTQALNHLIVFNTYTTDLIYSILAEMIPSLTVTKITSQRLEDDRLAYVRAIDFFSKNNIAKFLKELPTFPSTPALEVIEAEGTVVEGNIKDIPGMQQAIHVIGNGFVGNPIYHLRLWLADIAHERGYLRRKKEKEAVELILIDLRKQASGEHDKALEKQIEYYESLLSELEYKIAKYERNQ